jgi:hypothetical protein
MMDNIKQFPHCDQRILHAPGECEYCDGHPDWQALRLAWQIAFTGHLPADTWLPDPADYARPPGSPADHRQWGGNKPTFATGDASWPTESFASHVLYGDKGGRARTPQWRGLFHGKFWIRKYK